MLNLCLYLFVLISLLDYMILHPCLPFSSEILDTSIVDIETIYIWYIYCYKVNLLPCHLKFLNDMTPYTLLDVIK
jgi:hypothetical protein